MSDHISVKEARSWLDPSTGPKPEVPSPLLVDRYALTVIEQAETIQTLSRLLAGAEEAATERAEQIERVRHALNRIAREKAYSVAALIDGHGNMERHETSASVLSWAIHLITEALEGDDDEF